MEQVQVVLVYHISCELTGGQSIPRPRCVEYGACRPQTPVAPNFLFVISRDNTKHLDRNHTVFGKVYEGLDVIDKIRQDDVMEKVVMLNSEN